jgi:hypothetical protein
LELKYPRSTVDPLRGALGDVDGDVTHPRGPFGYR